MRNPLVPAACCTDGVAAFSTRLWVSGRMPKASSKVRFFLTSTIIAKPNDVYLASHESRLMKVVLRGQNQDALRSMLWVPANPQNLQV